MKTVAIVDFGMGNLHSLNRALQTLAPPEWRVLIVDTGHAIDSADKVVFPGQGAARDCMTKLKQAKLEESLIRATQEKPFLGICMGMQILCDHSEENDGTTCLGLLSGQIHHLSRLKVAQTGHKIPHMGWNRVRHNDHPMWYNVENEDYFYFVHSYFASPKDLDTIAGTCYHGDRFACSMAQDFIFSVQFHPEKSASSGMQILRNFFAWNTH